MPSTILSDNGASSGTAGIKTTGSNDGQLALQTTTAGGTATTALTIDTSQNVGIGTSSPNGKLDVSSSTNGGTTDLIVSNTFYASGSTDEVVTLQGEFYQNDVAARRAAGYIRFTKAGDFSNNANASANMLFATRNAGTLAEKMRITSAGEVLVGGTTSFVAETGNLSLEGTNTSTTLNFFRNDTSVGTNNILGRVMFWGNDTTSNTPTNLAYIGAVASGTHAAGDNPTDLIFGTTPDNTETVAEAGRITQSGAYVLKGGTTNPGGVGITFPATQSASTDANTLDDYEEGTWTPTFRGAGTAGTYTLSGTIATYTKVGRMVCISAYFTFSAASGGSAYAVIEGMPFNIGSVSVGIPYFASVDLSATTKYVTVQRISAATNTRLYFSEVVDNGSSIDLAVSAFTTSSTIQFSLVYEAA